MRLPSAYASAFLISHSLAAKVDTNEPQSIRRKIICGAVYSPATCKWSFGQVGYI